MGDLEKKPIRPDEVSKDWIESHRIEQDKKKEPPPFPKKEGPSLFEIVISYIFKKIIELFNPKSKEIDESKVAEHLITFKKFIEELEKEDFSHEPEFVEKLSASWCHLVDDFKQASLFQKKHPAAAAKINVLISEINAYPPGEEHSVGFYLTEHAGDKWIPFPYMEMLQELHRSKNQLNKWAGMCSEIISSLLF
jgi:hypothetical protein